MEAPFVTVMHMIQVLQNAVQVKTEVPSARVMQKTVHLQNAVREIALKTHMVTMVVPLIWDQQPTVNL